MGVADARRFEALAGAVEDIVFVTDLAGRMLWANAQLAKQTGYTAADFAFEQPDNPFLHPDDAARVGCVIAEVVAGGDDAVGHVDNRFRDRWGRIHAYRSTIQRSTWDDRAALLFVVRAAPQSRPTRAPSDESYRRIVEGANDGILKLASNGRAQFANVKMLELLGVSIVELGKRNVYDLVAPAERERAKSALQLVASSGTTTTFETRFEQPTGEPRAVEISASRLEDGDDAGLVLLIVRDVSTAHRFALAMREAQKLETIGVVASGLAHDFRNVVAAVLSGVTNAERAPCPEVRAEALAVVREAAERASELTSSLLAYVGRSGPNVEELDLADLVVSHERLLRAVIARGVTLRRGDQLAHVRVKADAGQLAQVLLNLVTNGGEAIRDGVGHVTVETRILEGEELALPGWRPSALPPGQYAALVVSDTGSGIPEATRARMFDAFYTTKQHGRGLGLAAVMAVVRSHGGAIRVDSEPGRGSRFTVVVGPALPATTSRVVPTRKAAEAAAAAVRADAELHDDGCVLLADDEPRLRRVTKMLLEGAGYAVESVATAEAAFEAFRAEPSRYSAVVLDVHMPDEDGTALLARLRTLRPDLPAVLTSGDDEAPVERDPISAFLSKPYHGGDLERALAGVLAARAKAG